MFVCISVCFGGCVWCLCNILENMFLFVEKVNILVYIKFILVKLYDNYFRINIVLKKDIMLLWLNLILNNLI